MPVCSTRTYQFHVAVEFQDHKVLGFWIMGKDPTNAVEFYVDQESYPQSQPLLDALTHALRLWVKDVRSRELSAV